MGPAKRNKTVVKQSRQPLVQTAADKMRELIFAQPPGTQIGSLVEVSQKLGVGIVTVQQAARILEHEGLLEVRRGPGGGYYGVRPNDAALERSLASYLRTHGLAYREVGEMISLLDTELMPAAARCEDETLHAALRALHARIETSNSSEARLAVEEDLHQIIFKMVNRPLFELLVRVTMQVAQAKCGTVQFPGEDGVPAWKAGRGRIVQAILDRDADRAVFEAGRYRKVILESLGSKGKPLAAVSGGAKATAAAASST